MISQRPDAKPEVRADVQRPGSADLLAAYFQESSGLPPELLKYRLLTLEQVCALAGIKKSKLYASIKQGIFPPPQHFGKSSRWSTGAVLRALGYEI